MTVLATNVVSGPLFPNGSTVDFPFDFEVVGADEVGITIDNIEVDPSQFSVTLNDDGTGKATFFTAPAGDGATNELFLFSNPDFRQQTTLANQGPYFQKTIEAVLDRLAIRILWLRDKILRLPVIPAIYTGIIGKFPVVLADGSFGWSSGTGADAGLRTDLGDAANGARIIRYEEQTVKTKLDALLSVEDNGALPALADNGVIIQNVLDAQLQPHSVDYGAPPVLQSPRKSVSFDRQYTIKSALKLHPKTIVRGTNGLNSGLTRAVDATGDAMFILDGTAASPTWSYHAQILTGAYSSLKAGDAFVRIDPTFPTLAGLSFVSRLRVTDVTVNMQKGIIVGTHYNQQLIINGFRMVGPTDQALWITGNHLVVDDMEVIGDLIEGDELDLVKIGDPAGLNPTTNALIRNSTVDKQGVPTKDSFSIYNAINVTLDSVHHELFDFNNILKVTKSRNVRWNLPVLGFATPATPVPSGPAFEGGELQPSGICMRISDSDVTLSYWDAWKANWYRNFELTGRSRLVIPDLRVFFYGSIPVNRAVEVEVERVSHIQSDQTVDSVRLPWNGAAANLLSNPTFQDGLTGWGAGGTGTPTLTLVPGGTVADPYGQILEITFAADHAGYFYYIHALPTLSGRMVSVGMIGEIDADVGVDTSNTFMCAADADLAGNHGRIVPGAGLQISVGQTQVNPGNLFIAIANPRMNTRYRIHIACASPGHKLTMLAPQRMAPAVTAAAGGATVDAEVRAEVAALRAALRTAGLHVT